MKKTRRIGQLHNWDETRLWQELDARDEPEAEEVGTTLKRWMPRIQTILAAGDTGPKDFTLHDSQHAFRVAERMVQVMPDGVLAGLSPYELALLLLAAYLHDIGMAPEQGRVRAHYQLLLTGTAESVSEDEVSALRGWLDEQGEEVDIPLCEGAPTPELVRRAGLLVTHYCRARHVDWGTCWIRAHLEGEELGTYAPWVTDLERLCRSHHEGFHELMGRAFEPKVVGAAPMVVHLRYLALLLRVADIMEFDPERTPRVVFQHREIDPASVVFWHKDHDMTYLLEGERLTISAEPSDARVHRAIEEMADDIEGELRFARRIDDERPLEVCRFQEEDLCHRWAIAPDLRRDIRPKGDAYEYIDGAFRPNTAKLLQLFSGKELYGDDMVAVRELLQNAFDAVREQIAYERLAQPEPSGPSLEEKLGKLHRVELRVEVEDGRVWLICSDDGVGMTKAIIRDHFLVSGAAERPDARRLERRCEEAGFATGRTAEFGIGVLSYFMLADLVQIETRRSCQPGDADPTGWVFETEGVGSFGELRRAEEVTQGTRVRLRVREELARDPKAFFQGIQDYVRATVRRIPCAFALRGSMADAEQRDMPSGWTREPAEMARIHMSSVAPLGLRERSWRLSETELLPAGVRRRYQEVFDGLGDLQAAVGAGTRWRTEERRLPGGIGRCRLHIPWFELPEGASSFFLRTWSDAGQLRVERMGEYHCYKPTGHVEMSWMGMRVRPHRPGRVEMSWHAIIEVDWQRAEAGRVSVGRREVMLTSAGEEAVGWALDEAHALYEAFAEESRGSPFVVLTHSLAAPGRYPEGELRWLVQGPGTEGGENWGPIRFPVVNRSALGIRSGEAPAGLRWSGRHVCPVRTLRCTDGLGTWDLTWNHERVAPDRIVGVDWEGRFAVTGLWLTQPVGAQASYLGGGRAEFPPGWGVLCGVLVDGLAGPEGTVVWNAAHPVCSVDDPSAEEWLLSSFKGLVPDPRPEREALQGSRAKALAWLGLVVSRLKGVDLSNFWDALVEQEGELLRGIWRAAVGRAGGATADERSVCFFRQERYSTALCVLSPDSCRLMNNLDEIRDFLPHPGPDWTLEIVG